MQPNPSITRDEAIALSKSGWWANEPARDVALFQLQTPLLCMPFSEFHRCVEEAIGRPVWTHEFANLTRLVDEINGARPAATFSDVLAQIPEGKAAIVIADKDRDNA